MSRTSRLKGTRTSNIDFKQAHADIAYLFRAANKYMTYEDHGTYTEYDLQQAQMRLSTLLERVRILEEEVIDHRPLPREPDKEGYKPCGEIPLGPFKPGVLFTFDGPGPGGLDDYPEPRDET